MLAFAMMAIIRYRANIAPPLKKTMYPHRTKHRSWSAGRFRKSAASSSSSHNGASNPRTSSHNHSGEELTKPNHAVPISKQKRNCNVSCNRQRLALLSIHLISQRVLTARQASQIVLQNVEGVVLKMGESKHRAFP
jgi:hypothetical protein